MDAVVEQKRSVKASETSQPAETDTRRAAELPDDESVTVTRGLVLTESRPGPRSKPSDPKRKKKKRKNKTKWLVWLRNSRWNEQEGEDM